MTLALPQHRLQSLKDTILATISRSRVSRRTWQRLIGVLRSSSPALYGATHLSSMIQYPLKEKHGRQIRVTALLRRLLGD
jgi:hypothetical protein